MARPTFTQNTVTGTWGNPAAPVTEPYAGLPSPPWYELKVPDLDGGSATGEFNNGFIELNGTATSRIFDYFSTGGDDEAIVQFPGGMGGLTSGNCVVSDDDLADLVVFSAAIYGCDNGFANGAVLLPPDVSALALRYHPAYIDPVHEAALSGTGGVTTFIENQAFGYWGDYGQPLWDQANTPTIRHLPISTPEYWTVMVVSAWQAETSTDGDPDTEQLTNGISTHAVGDAQALAGLGPSYTGLCAIFKALMTGEADIPERYTVAHEIGHTLGLPHASSGLMFSAESIGAPAEQSQPFSAESLADLREYNGP